MKGTDEQLVLFATSIAMELAKNLSIDEIIIRYDGIIEGDKEYFIAE